MTIDDLIRWTEDQFAGELGASWRWADLLMTKEYVKIEQMTTDGMRIELAAMKARAGFAADSLPRLYWRWENKVRQDDNIIITRVYLDGNPGYRSNGNPGRPNGSPSAGQMKLYAEAA